MSDYDYTRIGSRESATGRTCHRTVSASIAAMHLPPFVAEMDSTNAAADLASNNVMQLLCLLYLVCRGRSNWRRGHSRRFSRPSLLRDTISIATTDTHNTRVCSLCDSATFLLLHMFTPLEFYQPLSRGVCDNLRSDSIIFPYYQ